MIGHWIARTQTHKQFAARNRRDIDGFLSGFAEDATYVFPGTGAMSGTFQGMDEIRPWFVAFRTRFPEVDFRPREIYVQRPWGLKDNELAVYWQARLWDRDGAEMGGPGVTVVHIRGGKARYVHDFIFDIQHPFFHEGTRA